MPRNTIQPDFIMERHDLMSKQTVVKHLDDLNGEEFNPGTDGETVPFSLDGIAYEIDLTAPNAEGLRDALAEYIEHARRPQGGRRAVGKASSTSTSTGRREELAEVRSWLRANGYEVKDRGRIPASHWEAYRAGTAAPVVETAEAPALSVVPDEDDGSWDDQPEAEATVTDAMVLEWCEANGKKVELTKDDRPNSATRRKYLRAHKLAG